MTFCLYTFVCSFELLLLLHPSFRVFVASSEISSLATCKLRCTQFKSTTSAFDRPTMSSSIFFATKRNARTTPEQSTLLFVSSSEEEGEDDVLLAFATARTTTSFRNFFPTVSRSKSGEDDEDDSLESSFPLSRAFWKKSSRACCDCAGRRRRAGSLDDDTDDDDGSIIFVSSCPFARVVLRAVFYLENLGFSSPEMTLLRREAQTNFIYHARAFTEQRFSLSASSLFSLPFSLRVCVSLKEERAKGHSSSSSSSF